MSSIVEGRLTGVHRRRVLRRAVVLALLTCGVGAGDAGAQIVRAPHRRPVGVYLNPASRRHLARTSAVKPINFQGGAVMRNNSIYLIFWDPDHKMPSGYEDALYQWALDLAADSGKATNAFSIASLFSLPGGGRISRAISVGGAVDDPTPFPRNGCVDSSGATARCLNQAQEQREIADTIQGEGWPVDPANNPTHNYMLITPPNVSSCDDSGSCTFSHSGGFCGYHSSFQLNGGWVVWSNLPFTQCTPPSTPRGLSDGTAALLDTANHEVLEATTDPLTTDAAGIADAGGGEVGDACSPTAGDIVGSPLGGAVGNGSAFNQVINGHHYFYQEIWAPATPFTKAGCYQRAGASPVLNLPGGRAGTAVKLDASRSVDPAGKITFYGWNFGDGSKAAATTGPTITHRYAKPGRYTVTLVVADGSGFTNASTATATEVIK